VIVSILTVLLAGLFSSPDEPQLTFKGWATSAADNFYATAVQELAGTSESAGYGPPYNTAAAGITVGPLAPQEWFGVTHPVDAANDFVITPLRSQQQPATVAAALRVWDAAGADQQVTWAVSTTTRQGKPGSVQEAGLAWSAEGFPLRCLRLTQHPITGSVNTTWVKACGKVVGICGNVVDLDRWHRVARTRAGRAVAARCRRVACEPPVRGRPRHLWAGWR